MEYNTIRYTHKYDIRSELIWPALEALRAGSLTIDESAIQSFVKIKMRNEKRRVYNSATHLPIVLLDIRMLDYLATGGGIIIMNIEF
jgi:hypothetical protein